MPNAGLLRGTCSLRPPFDTTLLGISSTVSAVPTPEVASLTDERADRRPDGTGVEPPGGQFRALVIEDDPDAAEIREMIRKERPS